MSDNPLMNLEGVTKPVSDVAIALLEKIADASGTLYEPKHIVEVAKATAEAAEIQAESEIKIAKAKAESEIDIIDRRKRALNRWIIEQEQHQESIENTIAKAIPQLNEDADPHAVEDDWIIKFFDICRLVTDDQMQDIYAGILAGESNSAGSYSPKTLRTLADMNQKSLSLFNAFCSLCLVNLANPDDFLQSPPNFKIRSARVPIIRNVLNDTSIINSSMKFNLNKVARESMSIYKKYGFDNSEFLLLLEHGLIADDTFSEYNHFWYNNEIYVILKPSSNLRFKTEDVQDIRISGYRLTSVGTELFKIVEPPNPPEYLRTIIGFLQRHYQVKIIQ